MLRQIPDPLNNHLQQTVLTLALCVRIERKDGELMGFTTLDRDILIAESEELTIRYEARSSVEASAVRAEANTGVDNMEIIGLLDSSRISETDIRAGKYDGAAIELFMVNYRDPAAGKLYLITGSLGEITHSGGQFTAEIRSLAQRLQQSIGELTSALCRVKRLGDSRCKVDLTEFRYERTIGEVDSIYQFRAAGDNAADEWYTYGKVEVTSGENTGIHREIKQHTNELSSAIIILQEPFPFPLEVGTSIILEAGCDRHFATCRQKFDNVLNFRGEPHVPGNDKILKIGRR